jgi:DNA-binding LytR/AlgR family response regulator
MSDRTISSVKGRRLLIVEDDYLIAADLASSLEELGAEVIGPAGTVEDALELVQRSGETLDGAVLDINLREQRVYPVATALARHGVPFVFVTGYDTVAIPQAYASAPRCEKPVDKMQLMRWLSANAGKQP